MTDSAQRTRGLEGTARTLIMPVLHASTTPAGPPRPQSTRNERFARPRQPVPPPHALRFASAALGRHAAAPARWAYTTLPTALVKVPGGSHPRSGPTAGSRTARLIQYRRPH